MSEGGRRLLAVSSVARSQSGYGTTNLPADASEALGEPGKLAWLLDEETGLIYVVAGAEVSVR
jgi:hypothetical protein